MSAVLEFDQVSKYYGSRCVLESISFSIEHGEAVALVGINGAGKTTLLRGMLDLNRISSGRISIGGLPHTVTAARRQLTYLAERFTPPHFATGMELLRHLLALHGHTLERSAVQREAAALELDAAVLERPARDYSKGMAQKLGLIACILPRCPLLVLDEPMSGLDPKARALFKQRLATLREDGTSLFFSTHLLLDVEAVCDRVVIVHDTRLAFDGTPAALLAQTAANGLEAAFLRLIQAPG